MLLYYFAIVLPVMAAAALLAYLPIYLAGKRRRGKQPLVRHGVFYLLLIGVFSLLHLTIFWYGDITFSPTWRYINLRPFVWVASTYEMGFRHMMEQILANIAMFLPFGLLLPMAFPTLRRWWKSGLCLALFSLFIEGFQYVIGRSADVNDLIMNALGSLAGYGLFALMNRRFCAAPWWRKALGVDPDAGR